MGEGVGEEKREGCGKNDTEKKKRVRKFYLKILIMF